QADTAIELELRERIEKRYPAHGVLAEEYGDRTSNQESRWIIDPIDATHSYLRGVPAVATLNALERAGQPAVGVMSGPAVHGRGRSDVRSGALFLGPGRATHPRRGGRGAADRFQGDANLCRRQLRGQ